jgi:hypothetical protein
VLRWLCCLCCLLICTGKVCGQKQVGIEQYYFTGQPGSTSVVPMVYYQGAKGWFGTVRYNYEDDASLSVHGGKTFSRSGAVSLELTPMAGVLLGRSTGLVASGRFTASWRSLELSSEPQYLWSADGRAHQFFYNWTELSCQPLPAFYTGLALQHTRMPGVPSLTEPGILLGFSAGSFEFPLYCFNPLRSSQYFVLGVHWSWQKG